MYKILCLHPKTKTTMSKENELNVAKNIPATSENASLSPNRLLELAITSNADIDKLEKLMQLQERWNAQQANKAFLAALSNFQATVPVIEKGKQIKFGNTSYKFAPLGEIDAAIKSCMRDNGLTKRWEMSDDGANIICTCIISHIDGHSEKTTMRAIKDNSGGKNEIQQRASAVTYLQRYTLVAALGLSTADEDDDGHGSGDGPVSKPSPSEWLNEGTAQWNENVVAAINSGTSPSEVLASVEQKFKVNKIQKEKILAMKPSQQQKPPKAPSTDASAKIHLTAQDKEEWQKLNEVGSSFEKGKVRESLRLYNNNIQALTKRGVPLSAVKQTYSLDPEVIEHYEMLAVNKS